MGSNGGLGEKSNVGILRKIWILRQMIDSHVVDLCLFHQWVKCVLFIGTNPTNMLLKHGLKLEPLDFFEDLKGFHFNDFKL
jgi:hypothetical protein